jgi:hypothetical protein
MPNKLNYVIDSLSQGCWLIACLLFCTTLVWNSQHHISPAQQNQLVHKWELWAQLHELMQIDPASRCAGWPFHLISSSRRPHATRHLSASSGSRQTLPWCVGGSVAGWTGGVNFMSSPT